MIRDILDSQGNIIGQLTLPDETTEEQWAKALAHYTYVPPAPSLTEIITTKVQTVQELGNQIILDAVVNNISTGITQAGKTQAVSDYLVNLQRYLREGSLYAAMAEIDSLVNAEIPDTVQPYVTVDKLNACKLRIQTFLGLT